MAHKKGVGSTDNGRDSKAKRLGVKLFGGQYAKAGNIIIRQRGTKYHPGENVGIGRDHTLFALEAGTVSFVKKRNNRTYVNIDGLIATEEEVATKPVSAPKAAAAPKAEEPASEPKAKADDFKKIEGIGPKIAQLIVDAGITTFADLANTEADKIKEILVAAGSRYTMHDPTTWPQQSQLAADGKWDELKVLQDELDGGK